MIAAVDIGGTQTKYGVMNNAGQFIPPFPKSFPTPGTGFVAKLNTLILEIRESFPLKAVGISIAANVGREGTVLHATNLSISTPVELGRTLSENLGIPVKIENDGNCAALAISRFAGISKKDTFVVLTLGTGVGGGIIYNGELMDSGIGAAAELGHIVVDPAGPLCGCGKHGCLEAFIGESALVARYNRNADQPLHAALEISKLLKSGDEDALAVARFAGEQLGRGMAIISDIIAPRSFYIAGGVAGLGMPFLTAAKESLSRQCFLRLLNRTPSVELVAEAHLLSLKGAWVLAS
ncbi:MAG: ROK family protein [Acidobacteria bacterium]|nr:ROK family protein [Acidobacteriota bacterium]